MRTEPLPVDMYLQQMLASPQLVGIYRDWRLDIPKLLPVLSKIFKEMGIYEICPGHDKLVVANLVFHLRNAPEILNMRRRAEMSEMMRRNTRHSV